MAYSTKDEQTLLDILDIENGSLDEDEYVAAMQRLIDSGIVWQLQGSYGRAATDLIYKGACHYAPKRHHFYY